MDKHVSTPPTIHYNHFSITDLSRIKKPLKLLHQLLALIAPGLGVEKEQRDPGPPVDKHVSTPPTIHYNHFSTTDLSRIEKPLKLLHQLLALIAPGLGVEKDDYGTTVGQGDRLQQERRVIL